MKIKVAKMRKLLNSFRGVSFFSYDEPDEDGDLSIDFKCECRICLAAITSLMNNNPISILTLPYDTDLIFSLMFNIDEFDEIYDELKDIVIRNKDINEMFSKIDGFKGLDVNSRRKYFRYVKYLREKHLDGYFILSAPELLENERFCMQCGKELYTKQDERQAILEFDTAEKTYEKLGEIECNE